MRKSELEKLVKEQGEKIEGLGIIPKSREIAEKLGECKYRSREWASEDYVFQDESLRIHYEVYAMGDSEVDITCINDDHYHTYDRVFHAKEGSTQPQPAHPLFVKDDRRYYEILEYKPGPWTKRIDDLYNGISKTLEARKQEKEKEEALAKDPEVSENELKELEDRLGIKK
ncbi:MAG: hypothetical protein WC852_00835 [Candidatus Nanoarchaeia archaeon]|jgi:hypothetical protein